MQWRTTCGAMVALSAALVGALLFASGVLWWTFGVAGQADGDFAFRRAGMLFVLIGLVALAMRDAPPSRLRARLALAFAAGMAGLVVLGLGEVLRGFAGPGALAPVIAETGFGIAFARHWLHDRRLPEAV
ncbi:MAG: hypothetical protein KDK11_20185 [Maritimibacter sp.]|nr:hypothetical protein [Maritimibacter sp.]